MNKLYLVEAISQCRIRYAVYGKEEDHAADTVVMNEAEEMSQEFLGETITSIREIDEEEYLKIFDKDNGYLKPLSKEEKLKFIHTIDYDQ